MPSPAPASIVGGRIEGVVSEPRGHRFEPGRGRVDRSRKKVRQTGGVRLPEQGEVVPRNGVNVDAAGRQRFPSEGRIAPQI